MSGRLGDYRDVLANSEGAFEQLPQCPSAACLPVPLWPHAIVKGAFTDFPRISQRRRCTSQSGRITLAEGRTAANSYNVSPPLPSPSQPLATNGKLQIIPMEIGELGTFRRVHHYMQGPNSVLSSPTFLSPARAHAGGSDS